MNQIGSGHKLPLFFDREGIRGLKAPEEIKKKIYRQDKEARRLFEDKNLGAFLAELYLMAKCYSEKIAKEAKNGDETLSLRLEFSLWREVQFYAQQLNEIVEQPDFLTLIEESSAKLFQIAKTYLKIHDVAFSEITIRDLANGSIEKGFTALSFTPSETSVPGKLAKKLSESPNCPPLLCYSPWFTGAQGWAGKLTAKALYVSSDFIMRLEIDPDTGHELSHWQSAKAVAEFRGTPFLGDVLRGGDRPLPMSVGPYDGGVEFDELEAYGYNMKIGPERLKRAKTTKEFSSEVVWLRLEAESGKNIAFAIEEVLTETLSTLEKLSPKTKMVPIKFTANRRANSDPRPALWYCIGTSLQSQFGFQLTDLGKPGTEYVRAMVCSGGWIVGAPLFGEYTLKRAKEARHLHQQRPIPFILLSPFRKTKSPLPFLFDLRNALIKYFEKQKELAIKMGKDFSNASEKASAYLAKQSDEAKQDLVKAFEPFSQYEISEPVVV